MAAAPVAQANSSFLENNVSRPLIHGITGAAGGSIAARIFTNVIAVNPAITAVFMATMEVSDIIFTNFLKYTLNLCEYKENTHKYTYLAADMTASLGSIFLALKVSAISATALQLVALVIIGGIFGGILRGLICSRN